ncbi:Uncharacterised protein [Mycobacterium tuberculosis]|nr:Uncharacterised protein [Mycobacterium tuberculosis]
MMCTAFTPLLAASSAPSIFGSMPPEMVPSANRSSISRALRLVSSLPSLSSTPGVLVSSMSFSALSTVANLPATTSALML